MRFEFECKACDVDFAVSDRDLLSRPGVVACPACGAAPSAELQTGLRDAFQSLVEVMSSLRPHLRFEVVLDTDALPAPHGFDEDYSLAGEPEPGSSEDNEDAPPPPATDVTPGSL